MPSGVYVKTPAIRRVVRRAATSRYANRNGTGSFKEAVATLERMVERCNVNIAVLKQAEQIASLITRRKV